MVDLSHDRDLVIGSLYVPGGGTLNCPAKRTALSQGANAFAKVMPGLRAVRTVERLSVCRAQEKLAR